jgi:transposase
VVARQFVLKKIKRKKACCECHRTIITAPCPPKLFEGARYSIDFALAVVVSKYLDHQPLERQVRIMRREGLEVESQTLWDYSWAVAQLLRPAHARLLTHLLTKPALGADETWWRMMAAKGKRAGGDGKDWWMWSVCADDAVYYELRDSRSGKVAEELLSQYEGTVMCDGYSAYGSVEKQARFKLAHCWAHVRRKFFELGETSDAKQVLDYIDELFAIEAMPPTGPPGSQLRQKLRTERSTVIVKNIEQWALQVRALPQTPLRKAVEYMGNLWTGLTRFLHDADIPLSNNHTERALRGPVIGRKNFYGSRSKRGAEAAAILYSLCESAKLAGVEPNAYLRRAVLAALDQQPIPLPHELA